MNHLKKSLLALLFLTLALAVDKGTAASAQKPPGDSNVHAADNDNGKQSTQTGHSGDHTTAALSSGRSDELTLGDLRDSGIALNQIRQEAINIFLEATRTQCDKTTKVNLSSPIQ
jgi:hypothetical protein